MTTSGRFAGKVAFVTGAGRGIGRATAVAFAHEGASVVADLTEDHCSDTVRLIEEQDGTVLAVGCDVTSSDMIQAALQRATDMYGSIDIAFNNAGVEQPSTPAAEITEEQWDRVVDTNLRGVFLCMKYEIHVMLEHGGEVQAAGTSFERQTVYRCLRRMTGQEPGSAHYDLQDLGNGRLQIRA